MKDYEKKVLEQKTFFEAGLPIWFGFMLALIFFVGISNINFSLKFFDSSLGGMFAGSVLVFSSFSIFFLLFCFLILSNFSLLKHGFIEIFYTAFLLLMTYLFLYGLFDQFSILAFSMVSLVALLYLNIFFRSKVYFDLLFPEISDVFVSYFIYVTEKTEEKIKFA